MARCPQSGKPLRVLTTTLIWKLIRGTRLIAEPKGNNVKNWAIRELVSKSVMIGYDTLSTTTTASVIYDGLISLRLLKV